MSEQQNGPAWSTPSITIRPAVPADSVASQIDGSFVTETIYEVDHSATGFTFSEVPAPNPVVKHFPKDGSTDDESDDSCRYVAVSPLGGPCGFIDLQYEAWNRRLVVADIEIASAHRGRGLGQRLLQTAAEHGRAVGARILWLEVSNVNAPAIRSYLRAGFNFCGLDVTLYVGTESEGEIAIYMSRNL